ncbi:hypothetical protein OG474_30735 [Kribbella sp. NBC_01505]|uniref:Kelch repeat-containing protein n=1 Tax=Kribbella sp. NBC_01505 TaxID=2903580 RepID=UPI00386314E7
MTSETLLATGTWTTAGTLPAARSWLGQQDGPVVVKKDSKEMVLLAGGADSSGTAVNECFLFDPNAATPAWAVADKKMVSARRMHTVTVIDSGKKVLVTGGATGSFQPAAAGLNTAEIYDIAAGTWTATATTMKQGRWGHTATVLPDDKVLITGGSTQRVGNSIRTLSSAEIYDVKNDTWADAVPMLDARSGHSAFAVNNQVLVVGGGTAVGPQQDTALAYCEIYDPTSKGWTSTASLAAPRRGHHAVQLTDGKVVVVGGAAPGSSAGGTFQPFSLATVERYDPGPGTWSPLNAMGIGRSSHRVVEVKAGKLLVAGGTDSSASGGYQNVNGDAGYQSATLLTSDWAAEAPLTTGRWGFGAVALSGDRVLVVGGVVQSGSATAVQGVTVLTNTAEFYKLPAGVTP